MFTSAKKLSKEELLSHTHQEEMRSVRKSGGKCKSLSEFGVYCRALACTCVSLRSLSQNTEDVKFTAVTVCMGRPGHACGPSRPRSSFPRRH
ncbi:hypothetical protein VULLAG_LOCUS10891 [Vulpes lagopus]